MRTYLDCIPCFFEQALRAGRAVTDDERVLKRLLDELGLMLSQISLENSPPETGRLIYRMVREITGSPDPFHALKRASTQRALQLYPSLKQRINDATDSLLTAIRLAIAGNVIDFGPQGDYDIDAAIEESLTRDFAIFDYAAFAKRLAAADDILYIGDNAGETVFDRLLIETMKKPTIYVVHETPVINDATLADAIQAGLDQTATIVSSGTDAPGTIPHTCTAEFRQMLAEADFSIAKGQGNYEALSQEDHAIFFLLKAKCDIIAQDIGVSKGDIVLKGINFEPVHAVSKTVDNESNDHL